MAETRVLWLVKGLGLGGTEHLLAVAAPLVAAQGVAVEVAYVLPWKDALVPRLREAGVTVHCLGTGRGGVRAWPVRLCRLLSAQRYDVVHTHSPVPAVVARLWPGARRSRLRHTEHSAWGRYRFPTRAANAATLFRNEGVWAVSQAVASSMVLPRWARRLPVPALPPIEVLYHGIDERTVRRGAEARRDARALLSELGVPADARIVGSVGNLAPKKDQATLLAAFEALAADRPDLELVLVGGGPLEGELRAQAASLAGGVGDRVHFLGQRPDVPVLLPGFDVFALSSRHEGLGLVLIEAMAAGLPVVGTRVDGIPEVVTDEADGILVAPGAPGALADAVGRILDDDELAARLRAEGERSAQRFSIGTAAATMAAAYTGAPAPEVPPPPAKPKRPRLVYDIRPYDPAADQSAVMALLQTSLGGGPVGQRTVDFFEWKHEQNPFGRSFAFVADADGEIVGFRTFMRWRWRTAQRTYEAVRAVDTATHPKAQGQGIFKALTLGAVEGIRGEIDLIFNTPNANSRPGYLKMGWTQVGTVPISIRPIHPVRLAQGIRRIGEERSTEPIACALPSAADAFPDDDEVAELLAAAHAPDDRLATDRSAAYLRWRYAQAPDLDYRVVVAREGGRLTGLGFARPRRRGPLAELTLSEVVVAAGDSGAARSVLHAAVRDSGCDHAATVVGPDPTLATAFLAAGFLPAPGQGTILTSNPLADDVVPDPRELSSWRFALGDLEVF